MKSLHVELENCYGIGSFKDTFDFPDGKQVVLIYAPNGVMKSSFAKTFQQLHKEDGPKDLLHSDRTPKYYVKDSNQKKIPEKQIFVIHPYFESGDKGFEKGEEGFKPDSISTLLVNPDYQKKYEELTKAQEKQKVNFLKRLKENTGLMPKKLEEEFSKVFRGKTDKFWEALGYIESAISKSQPPGALSEILYNDVFNEKTEKFLSEANTKKNLKQYSEIYRDLQRRSKFFRPGGFDKHNAEQVINQLEKNNFFDADHQISLRDKLEQNSSPPVSKEDYESLIEADYKAIVKDENLHTIFRSLRFDTIPLEALKKILAENPYLVPELETPKNLKQDILKDYCRKIFDDFSDLFNTYKQNKSTIESILKQATEEQSAWREIIRIFNERFSVPFKLTIDNNDLAIVKKEPPRLGFRYAVSDQETEGKIIEKTKLLQVLSQGERRALYILNIIFEIEARRQSKKETIFIIDDIADSFDYKNKFAIIEYLQEMQRDEFFFQIILTHNYDFYRTVESRFGLDYSQCFHAQKRQEKIGENGVRSHISLKGGIKQKMFDEWKKSIKTEEVNYTHFFALIPFARNVIDYSNHQDTSKVLTSILHAQLGKIETVSIADIYAKLKDVLLKCDESSSTLENCNKNAFNVLCETADKICASPNEDTSDLAQKVTLSIAIRVKAEKYVVSAIPDESHKYEKMSTRELFDTYKEKVSKNDSTEKNIKTLKKILLMTPENIHLNSFAYEPLIDMSNEHLIDLYKDVCSLDGTSKEG